MLLFVPAQSCTHFQSLRHSEYSRLQRSRQLRFYAGGSLAHYLAFYLRVSEVIKKTRARISSSAPHHSCSHLHETCQYHAAWEGRMSGLRHFTGSARRLCCAFTTRSNLLRYLTIRIQIQGLVNDFAAYPYQQLCSGLGAGDSGKRCNLDGHFEELVAFKSFEAGKLIRHDIHGKLLGLCQRIKPGRLALVIHSTRVGRQSGASVDFGLRVRIKGGRLLDRAYVIRLVVTSFQGRWCRSSPSRTSPLQSGHIGNFVTRPCLASQSSRARCWLMSPSYRTWHRRQGPPASFIPRPSSTPNRLISAAPAPTCPPMFTATAPLPALVGAPTPTACHAPKMEMHKCEQERKKAGALVSPLSLVAKERNADLNERLVIPHEEDTSWRVQVLSAVLENSTSQVHSTQQCFLKAFFVRVGGRVARPGWPCRTRGVAA